MSPFSVIILTLLFSAFFSGLEIAFFAANRLRLELLNQKGDTGARLTMFFIRNPSRFLTTTLIGNNVALIVFGVFMANIIEGYINSNQLINSENTFVIFLIQTIVSSFLVLILAEFIPKTLFRINPNGMLLVLCYPFILFYYILYPIVKLMDFLSKSILKYIFRTQEQESALSFSRNDLIHYVEEGMSYSPTEDRQENQTDLDTQIFKNAIEFHTIMARDCMTPRTEIIAMEVTQPILTLQKKFIESGHSKLLIYRNTIDDIIGYVHQVDMFKSPKSIDKIIMPIYNAPESMPAQDVLKNMLERHRSIAVVLDEFGGTAGIVTIEDIIEEIIGDIEDEHDVEDWTEKKLTPNEYLFSARLEIDYLNEKYNLNLPEGDYETLGGFILNEHQDIPDKDEVIHIDHFEFVILDIEQNKIKEVKLKVNPLSSN